VPKSTSPQLKSLELVRFNVRVRVSVRVRIRARVRLALGTS